VLSFTVGVLAELTAGSIATTKLPTSATDASAFAVLNFIVPNPSLEPDGSDSFNRLRAPHKRNAQSLKLAPRFLRKVHLLFIDMTLKRQRCPLVIDGKNSTLRKQTFCAKNSAVINQIFS
jgi:hypothetical protein